MPTATPRLMGAEVKRKEDPRLVTGTSSYVDDITIPGLHYVAFVRSPHAHAKVGTIDTTAAAKRAGVLKIVTGQDIRAHCQPIPLGGPSAEGGGGAETSGGRKHYPLSIGRVRHVGEPVAVVIATDRKSVV
jgi:carbon-monoxide dehydrogenase large subunit